MRSLGAFPLLMVDAFERVCTEKQAVHLLCHLSKVLHNEKDIVPSQDEPIEVFLVVEIDVFPNGPALLPHVSPSLWSLVLDLKSDFSRPMRDGETHVKKQNIYIYVHINMDLKRKELFFG